MAKSPLLADLQGEAGQLGREVRELVSLRWSLAMLELRADARSIKRLAIVLVIATVAALTALPLLAVSAAECLDQVGGITRIGWLMLFAGCLLMGSLSIAWLGWRRFQRHFIGLRQTLEEIHEDAIWLQEWLDTNASSDE